MLIACVQSDVTFADPADYEFLETGTKIIFPDIREVLTSALTGGAHQLKMQINDGGHTDKSVTLRFDLDTRDIEIILAGGKLAYTRTQVGG